MNPLWLMYRYPRTLTWWVLVAYTVASLWPR